MTLNAIPTPIRRATNDRLRRLHQAHPMLVVAHRGYSAGAVPDNSRLAAIAAVRAGANVVEVDVSRTTDGVYYAFHDGVEEQHLGTTTNAQQMSSAELGTTEFRWCRHHDEKRFPEQLAAVLLHFRGEDVLFNIDRSWSHWPHLLHELAELDMDDQLLIKYPANLTTPPAALAGSRQQFPTIAICRTADEVSVTLDHAADFNLVGVELVTGHEPGFPTDQLVRQVSDAGWQILINSEVLPEGPPLFRGWDDDLALTEGPESAWGHLLDLGVTMLQTDHPWLAASWLAQRSNQQEG